MTIRDVELHFHTLVEGDEAGFDRMARAVSAYQRRHCPVYARYPGRWLPVEAFKLGPVATFAPEDAELVFESSGTGRTTPSRHYVRKQEVYERSVAEHFRAVFGPGPFTLLAHLPHYAASSSLVYMMRHLIACFGGEGSGFFLEDTRPLEVGIAASRATGHRLLLFGAAFGLLDLVEARRWTLPPEALVIETGGMKTHRREVDRATLHAKLAPGFGLSVAQVWSEYGMCELLSQCYTRGGPVFFPPPWMRFEVVDPLDPDRVCAEGEPGVLALNDLANLYSVSTLLTEDRAVRRGGGFEVLGRLSSADLRGCNFLVERR